MDLSNLSATELSLLDAVCLEFETRLRKGETVSIDELVRQHGGKKTAQLLRRELQAIAEEIENSEAAPQIFTVATDSHPSAGDDTHPDSPQTISVAPTPYEHDSVADEVAHADTGEANPPEPLKRQMPVPGNQLGPYRLTQSVASGGMGTVYQATDTRLNRTVAIKVLTMGTTRRRELMERFEREARAVAALSHPNIIELFDVGVAGDLPYAVMEYVDGPTLAQRMQQGQLPIDDLREIGAQIASALVTAHQNGVIHRDLKPQNIMLVPTGEDAHRIKLLDFGLSRALRDDALGGLEDDTNRTRAGTILGTPGYMSPEQARGESATSAADIFGLGCILYEGFYGKPAIEGKSVAERFAATLTKTPVPDPIRRREDVALADLIDKCVASEPADRPSAAETLTLLRAAEPKSDSLRALPQNAIGRRRFGLALFGGTAGLVATAYWISGGTNELSSIQTLAVLSFDDQSAGDIQSGIPLGDRDMTPGERIAATLVNELSRIDQIGVLPFRPLQVSPGDSYQNLGDKLNIDAFVAGSIRQDAGSDQNFVEVTLQIISAKSGNQLWSETLRRPADDCMLKHSGLAGEIAQRIGRRLTATVNQPSPPSRELYNCYVDGKARADIESVGGLQRSLMCFQQAHDAAPDLVDPLAAIVMTSLTLASQSSQVEANEYMQTALVNLQKALQLQQETVELQLAKGTWEWQKLKHFDEAEKILGELSRRQPYHWQVQHQYGLLLAALSEDTLARKHLQDAVLLNSMSLAVKVDRRRLDWFRGYDVEALSGTKTYLNTGTSDTGTSESGKSDALARGLMVDILEQQGDYDRAGEVLRWKTPALTRAAYYDRRSESLQETPYGLFGDRLNQVILETRRGKELTAADLEDLQLGPFPMFPLLFARHPAFAPARLLPEAKQYLPNPNAV